MTFVFNFITQFIGIKRRLSVFLLSPFSQSYAGVSTFFKGLKWLRNNPRYLLVLFLPVFLSAFLIVSAWGVFFSYHSSILSWLMFSRPEGWVVTYFLLCFACSLISGRFNIWVRFLRFVGQCYFISVV